MLLVFCHKNLNFPNNKGPILGLTSFTVYNNSTYHLSDDSYVVGMLIFLVTPSGSDCPHSEEAEPASSPGDEPGPWSQLLNGETEAKIQSFFFHQNDQRAKP